MYCVCGIRRKTDSTPRTSALRQQLESKRYEYNALLSPSSPDSAKINAVAKEMETLRQSLNEQRVKRDVEMAQAGVPRGTGCDSHGHRSGGHMMGHW
ncbi:TPA: periplasmic heavy metal sensor [Escherichia coli]|nr:periplasmic heavy metal sensor [Escherichia coli]HAN4997744.1 zinc resistance sensor/chaperone ZraP [Escherichia coli]HCB2007722.1 periplasmic heavy metal sensor [Escherichia coli]HDW2772298.1 periplasmic heavy metal sensor [Escherichia coli]